MAKCPGRSSNNGLWGSKNLFDGNLMTIGEFEMAFLYLEYYPPVKTL